MALVAFTKGQLLLASAPSFWSGEHSGEQQRLSEPFAQSALDAIKMLRKAQIKDYSITDLVAEEFKLDNYFEQRVIEIAWPIKPARNSQHVLRLNSEVVPNCRLIATSDKVSLCVRE
jgi:hypothetical protein